MKTWFQLVNKLEYFQPSMHQNTQNCLKLGPPKTVTTITLLLDLLAHFPAVISKTLLNIDESNAL